MHPAFPAEVTSIVISYLLAFQNSRPSDYVTVSRQWQGVIERKTFAEINLKTPQRFEEFKRIVTSDRRSFCRKINYLVELDSYDIEARGRFETLQDQNQNNQTFTKAIVSLLQALAEWPENHVGVSLSIQARSPSDFLGGWKERQKRFGVRGRNPEKDLLHQRYEHSYLLFESENLQALAPVPVVTGLWIRGALRQDRLIHPVSCTAIASKLPQLKNLRLELRDCNKRDVDLRKQMRTEFVESFHLWSSSIQGFDLDYADQPPSNQHFMPLNLLNGAVEDPLSTSLRIFSQQLTSIDLDNIVIAKELFWPLHSSQDKTETPYPYWPNLTRFSLDYSPCTPSGGWYFERGPDPDEEYEGSTEYFHLWEDLPVYLQPPPEDQLSNLVRTRTCPDLFNELYLCAGLAAQQMPQLKYMSLKSDSDGRISHGLQYTVNGKAAKACWVGDEQLKVEERVFKAWREAATQHTGVPSSLEMEFDFRKFSWDIRVE